MSLLEMCQGFRAYRVANGTIAVTFEEKCILTVVSNMFGESMTELNSEIADAVGELTNMISGQARRELRRNGKGFQAAIPSVVTGKEITVFGTIQKGPKIAIPFNTDSGDFTIEVCFER
jgi:chemotaxis protein CheX